MERAEPTILCKRNEFSELNQFLETDASGFVYLRGRRRVGKTTLLNLSLKNNSSIFYFTGVNDETSSKTVLRFVKNWISFSSDKKLAEIKMSLIDWEMIFNQIGEFSKQKNVILIFDEIQWIAKGKSSFIGLLKYAWSKWELTGKIKIVICGSSNKFFIDHTGGEEKILRGLKTRSDIVVKPLSFTEAKKYYFQNWTLDEAMLSYMMLGGIPYYLNKIPKDLPFFSAMNKAIFLATSIFLDEVFEILNLEFNEIGSKKVYDLMSNIGGKIVSQAFLSKQLSMSDSAIFELVNKLVNYKLLSEYKVFSPGKKEVKKYFIDDFYLHFYFTILKPLIFEIRENNDAILIRDLIPSSESFYISGFSGRAFELFIRDIFLSSKSNEALVKIIKFLDLPNNHFELYDSFEGHHGPDFVIRHLQLEMLFFIECKWTNSMQVIQEGIDQLKKLPLSIKNKGVLISNTKFSKATLNYAHQNSITLISLNELLC